MAIKGQSEGRGSHCHGRWIDNASIPIFELSIPVGNSADSLNQFKQRSQLKWLKNGGAGHNQHLRISAFFQATQQSWLSCCRTLLILQVGDSHGHRCSFIHDCSAAIAPHSHIAHHVGFPNFRALSVHIQPCPPPSPSSIQCHHWLSKLYQFQSSFSAYSDLLSV